MLHLYPLPSATEITTASTPAQPEKAVTMAFTNRMSPDDGH